MRVRKQLLKVQLAKLKIRKLTCVFVLRHWSHAFQTKRSMRSQAAPEADAMNMPHEFELLDHIMSRFRMSALWAICTRRLLHNHARASSREDRITFATKLAHDFETAAWTNHSKQIYRALRPLLGQEGRKRNNPFRPLPAVKDSDGCFVVELTEATERWRSYFAAAEGGMPVTCRKLQELEMQQGCPSHEPIPFDLEAIPTLADLESISAEQKKAKLRVLIG